MQHVGISVGIFCVDFYEVGVLGWVEFSSEVSLTGNGRASTLAGFGSCGVSAFWGEAAGAEEVELAGGMLSIPLSKDKVSLFAEFSLSPIFPFVTSP